jgi:hypothetical protein
MPDTATAKRAKQTRELRQRVKRERRDARKVAADLATSSELDAGAAAEFEVAVSRVDTLNARLRALPKPKVKVVRESEIYEQGDTRRSFFVDLAAAMDPGAPVPLGSASPDAARERLQRHARYELDRIEARRAASVRAVESYGLSVRRAGDPGVQARADSALLGIGGEFVPPRWLVEYFASVARAAAPLKTLCRQIDLPDGTLDVHVPRFVSVAGVQPMQAENVNPPLGPEQSDELVHHVATFAGDGVLSQQLFDRGGMFADQIMAQDFAEAYAQSLPNSSSAAPVATSSSSASATSPPAP